ncbi:MAG: tRNA (guanosine(46)-N7)-methyltransferase TrmB [Verrucomicrobiales bacterium]|nr:tRNA (guanosine(46)-N7)-methyltransferase TrmB [Verrucomicrobiales bacterium]
MSRKKVLPPGQTLLHPITSAVEPIDLAGLFSTRQPLELELGCGDGSFTLQYALANPGRNIVALERLLGRITKLDRKGHRAGLKNLRLLRAEAAYVLEYLLPPGLLDAIHVYFPDPWPKKRHHKNRLISEPFPPLAKRLLREGGIVYLRTDNIEYFEQMLEVFGDAVGFETVETPEPMKQLVTDFEQQFNAQGIPTNYAAYRSVGE